jgi:FtsP/CotA-like multicopper oxidase with cupredoxin domain
VIAGFAHILAALPVAAAVKHPRGGSARARHGKRPIVSTEVPKLSGTALPIPPLIELRNGGTLELTAGSLSHAFLPDKPLSVTGYNGIMPGPTVRLTRGETTKVHLANGLTRPTNVHWHGLIVDPNADAALIAIPPGDTWETTLIVDQPAATLWYHEHMLISPQAGRGAGLLIVSDGSDVALGLPSTYGVDDFPIILDDTSFDASGNPVDQPAADAALIGTRGNTILVNGVADALLKVPQKRVRLRLLNAARARVFRLFMDDERSFQLIAGDGGYVPVPDEIDTLILAPGERAEIIVDFADGSTSLLSTPDDVAIRSGAEGTDVVHHPDSFEKQFRVLGFDAFKDTSPQKPMPTQLPASPVPPVPDNVKHRRFEFNLHTTDGAPGIVATINGKTFDPARIDVNGERGTTEIWQLVAPDMPHTVHIAGAQVHVLAQDGDTPRAWNRGPKDTIFVENSIDIQVTFALPAPAATPYVIESALPEHAAEGAIATVVVG